MITQGKWYTFCKEKTEMDLPEISQHSTKYEWWEESDNPWGICKVLWNRTVDKGSTIKKSGEERENGTMKREKKTMHMQNVH